MVCDILKWFRQVYPMNKNRDLLLNNSRTWSISILTHKKRWKRRCILQFLPTVRHSKSCKYLWIFKLANNFLRWTCGTSSEFVSSSIPSWQILTAHDQPFRGARDLAFCLTVPLDSLLVWASSGGSGETARMRRVAWTFADRIGDK